MAWPYSSSPQQCAVPSVLNPHEWFRPVLIEANFSVDLVSGFTAAVGVAVASGVGAGVAVAVGIAVGSGAGVAVAVGVAVASGVGAGVAAAVGVASGVGAGVAVAVTVATGEGETVDVGAGSGLSSQATSVRIDASAATASIARRALGIPVDFKVLALGEMAE